MAVQLANMDDPQVDHLFQLVAHLYFLVHGKEFITAEAEGDVIQLRVFEEN